MHGEVFRDRGRVGDSERQDLDLAPDGDEDARFVIDQVPTSLSLNEPHTRPFGR